MPFTLAHAAAALPFRRTRLILSAVVVGTFAPDFEYFLRLVPGGHFGHTLPGVFVLDLPLSLVVLWLFHTYMREPIMTLLPEPIQRFTTKGVYDDEHSHLSFIQGGGHGGSHPHLANEFIMSLVEERPSFPDVYQSLNWTCAGICAHESAMRGGEIVKLPDFRS